MNERDTGHLRDMGGTCPGPVPGRTGTHPYRGVLCPAGKRRFWSLRLRESIPCGNSNTSWRASQMTDRGKSQNSAGRARWYASAEFATVWQANLALAWEAQRTLPRCGAKRRTTGEPCRNLALPNGKCRLHGGRTPKGNDWHKAQLVNPGASLRRLEKKERELEKRRAKLEARIAAMTPDELARYQAWHAARAAGPSAGRQRRRDNLRARDTLSRIKEVQGTPESGVQARRLADMLQEMEAAAARLRRTDINDDEGDIFA